MIQTVHKEQSAPLIHYISSGRLEDEFHFPNAGFKTADLNMPSSKCHEIMRSLQIPSFHATIVHVRTGETCAEVIPCVDRTYSKFEVCVWGVCL